MASGAPTERPLPERRPSMARERKPSMSAPLSELQGPVGPGFTRPKHKRTVTGFGPSEIKAVEASIPEPQRAALVKLKLHAWQLLTLLSQVEELCKLNNRCSSPPPLTLYYRRQSHSRLQKNSRYILPLQVDNWDDTERHCRKMPFDTSRQPWHDPCTIVTRSKNRASCNQMFIH